MLNILTNYFLVALLILSNTSVIKGQRESEGDKEGDSEGGDNSEVESAVTTEHSGDEDSEQEEGTADAEEDKSQGRSGHDHDSMNANAAVKIRPTRRRPQVATQDSLYCYSCKYQHNATNDLCLDPGRNDVDSKECKVRDSQCFTFMQMSDDNEDLVESVVRGCKSNCGSSREFTCCGTPMCNSQVFMMMMSHAAHPETRHNISAAFTEKSNANRVLSFANSVMSFISALALSLGNKVK